MIFRLIRQHPWLTALGFLCVLGAGLHLALEWRAQNAWDKYATEARHRGVKLMTQDFTPPTIPDDQNFAKLPMFEALKVRSAPIAFELPEQKGEVPGLADPAQAGIARWVEWQQYFQKNGWISNAAADPVQDVLRGLEHFAPAFAEWSEWRNRPQCRFQFDFSNGIKNLTSPSVIFQRANKAFRLRMLAHLAARDSNAAWSDFENALQSYRAIRNEPIWMTRLACTMTAASLCAGVSEGLQTHAWAEAELQKLALALDEFDIARDLKLAVTSMRAYENQLCYERLLSLPAIERSRQVGLGKDIPVIGREISTAILLPRWFYRENQLRMNRYYDALESRLAQQGNELDGKTPLPAFGKESEFNGNLYPLCYDHLKMTVVIVKRFWHLQALLQQTRQAVALERAFKARGAFPESTGDLVPEFLRTIPVDNFSGQPLLYKKTGENSYTLYSVGENLLDDGGQIEPKVSPNRQPDIVWPYAPAP